MLLEAIRIFADSSTTFRINFKTTCKIFESFGFYDGEEIPAEFGSGGGVEEGRLLNGASIQLSSFPSENCIKGLKYIT